MSELRGRLRLLTSPSRQLAVPAASVATRLMTHVLVMMLWAFGMGSGGPNRHPGRLGYSTPGAAELVQVRFGWVPPMSVVVVGPSVRLPVPASQAVILVTEAPMSGTVAGNGTLSWPPPK